MPEENEDFCRNCEGCCARPTIPPFPSAPIRGEEDFRNQADAWVKASEAFTAECNGKSEEDRQMRELLEFELYVKLWLLENPVSLVFLIIAALLIGALASIWVD